MKLLRDPVYAGATSRVVRNARNLSPRRTRSRNVRCEIVSVRGFSRSVTRRTNTSRLFRSDRWRLMITSLPANESAATTVTAKRFRPTLRRPTRGRTSAVSALLRSARDRDRPAEPAAGLARVAVVQRPRRAERAARALVRLQREVALRARHDDAMRLLVVVPPGDGLGLLDRDRGRTEAVRSDRHRGVGAQARGRGPQCGQGSRCQQSSHDETPFLDYLSPELRLVFVPSISSDSPIPSEESAQNQSQRFLRNIVAPRLRLVAGSRPISATVSRPRATVGSSVDPQDS